MIFFCKFIVSYYLEDGFYVCPSIRNDIYHQNFQKAKLVEFDISGKEKKSKKKVIFEYFSSLAFRKCR